MKILVVGSLKDIPRLEEICEKFVRRLGELIVEHDHTLLTGCRGSLDAVIAESAHKHLEKLHKDTNTKLVSYRLKDSEPVHRYGTILISARKDWELTHPELTLPEQISGADVAIFIAGHTGTFIAANWARIAGKSVLGVALFGGAGEALYEKEYKCFEEKYSRLIGREDFQVLNQDTKDVDKLAHDVVSLSERIFTPHNVFPIMPFTTDFDDVFASYREVCKSFKFDAERTDKSETTERIVPRIIEGIRSAAFVIADISEVSPNVYYEIGFAQGLGKPLVLTAKKGTKLPFDVIDVPVIFWRNQEDLKEQLRKRIGHIVERFGRCSSQPEKDKF
jgi:hypothetical protein